MAARERLWSPRLTDITVAERNSDATAFDWAWAKALPVRDLLSSAAVVDQYVDEMRGQALD